MAGDAARIPIVDCDIHPRPTEKNPLERYVPERYHEAIRMGMAGARSNGYANPFGVDRRDISCEDPAATGRDHLDRYNIAYALVQSPGMVISVTNNIDIGSVLAAAWNEWQAEVWLAADKRYLGSVAVNMNDPPVAAKEIRRWAGHKQVKQVIVCGESEFLYGHRFYHPVYEACAETGLSFTVHPGREGVYRSATPVGRPASYFEWHTVVPLTYQAHIVSLVAEGVFEKYPKLKVMFTEAGVGWLPHVMWRMDKNFKALRATTPWLKRLPSEYMIDHLRLTTQPLEEPESPEHLLQMLAMVHAEKTVCFSSDFPHWDFDDPLKAFPSKMPDALRRRIFYENAAELFGLPSLEQTQAAMAERATVGAGT